MKYIFELTKEIFELQKEDQQTIIQDQGLQDGGKKKRSSLLF